MKDKTKRPSNKNARKENKKYPYKKRKPIVIISFAILIIFSFVGLLIGGGIIHENIHKSDYRSVSKFSDEMCYLTSGWEGYYGFEFPDNQQEEVKRVLQYTEFKAYGIQSIITLIYFVAIVMVAHRFL